MTPLRIIENPYPGEIPGRMNTSRAQPGDMWRVPEGDETAGPDAPTRECWAIVLPNGAGVWLTTERAGHTNNLWDVTGEPPAITVSPSIDAGPEWHGHITNGEMTP